MIIMNNNYTFEHLKKRRLPSLRAEADVLFKILNIINDGVISRTFKNISELYSILVENDYYITHNLVIKQGKKSIFKSRLFLSKKDDLILFLDKTHINNDIRCFIIKPLLSEHARREEVQGRKSFILLPRCRRLHGFTQRGIRRRGLIESGKKCRVRFRVSHNQALRYPSCFSGD